jgi:hypothetical protein
MLSTIILSFLLIPPFTGHLCTAKDPDFDGYRYKEQIAHCKRKVSTARKNKICKRDGVDDRRDFKVDHIIPLSIGGSNHDTNLWCQHKSIDTAKYEYELYSDLKAGRINQKEAILKILQKKFKKIDIRLYN